MAHLPADELPSEFDVVVDGTGQFEEGRRGTDVVFPPKYVRPVCIIYACVLHVRCEVSVCALAFSRSAQVSYRVL